MTLLEATKDPQVPTRIIEAMQHRPLSEIAAEPWVAGPLGPVLERHRAAVDVVRRLARVERGVVTVDLAGSGLESANKFIAYDLFPDAAYTVVVTRDAKRAKVSVGSNPWARPARPHDISKLCEPTAAAATPWSERCRSRRTGSTTRGGSRARSRRALRTEPSTT